MKVWVINLKNTGSRVAMRAYGTRAAAVKEMESIKEQMERQLHYTEVMLEEVDGLLVLALYGDEDGRIGENAVMTELRVIQDSVGRTSGDPITKKIYDDAKDEGELI
jgi:hypothetical protein